MSDVDKIDETLDQLERAVEGLTSSTNLDALRYIHELGTAPGCSRHAAESVRHIAEMYVEAEASLMAGLDHIEADADDAAGEEGIPQSVSPEHRVARDRARAAHDRSGRSLDPSPGTRRGRS